MKKQLWILSSVGIILSSPAYSEFDKKKFENEGNIAVIAKIPLEKGHLGHIGSEKSLQVAASLADKLSTLKEFTRSQAINTAYSFVQQHPAVKDTCSFNDKAPEYQRYLEQINIEKTVPKAADAGGISTSKVVESTVDTYGASAVNTAGQIGELSRMLGMGFLAAQPVVESAFKAKDEPCPVGADHVADLEKDRKIKLAEAEALSKPNNPDNSKPGTTPKEPPVLSKALPEGQDTFTLIQEGAHQGISISPSPEVNLPPDSPHSRGNLDNVAVFREALDQKVLRKEIEPAVAQALLSHFTPSLEREADLISALDKGTRDLKSNELHPSYESQIAPSKPPVLGDVKLQQDGSKTETESTANSPRRIGSASNPSALSFESGVTRGVSNLQTAVPTGGVASTGDQKKTASKENVAQATNALLSKKNAPVAEKPGSGSANEKTSSAIAAAGSLFSKPGTSGGILISNGKKETEKPAKPVVGITALGKFIDQVAGFFRPKSVTSQGLRAPASQPAQDEAKVEQEAKLTLAGFTEPTLPETENEISSEQASLAFLTAFTSALVGFGFWHRWKRKNNSRHA